MYIKTERTVHSLIVIFLLTCKEILSIIPASQKGTNAKYANRSPASYLFKENHYLKSALLDKVTQILE